MFMGNFVEIECSIQMEESMHWSKLKAKWVFKNPTNGVLEIEPYVFVESSGKSGILALQMELGFSGVHWELVR
jgi:hypothetical protein